MTESAAVPGSSGSGPFTAPTWDQVTSLNSTNPPDPDDAPGDLFSRRFMNWMSFLRTDVPLTTLIIPGTHESATYSMRDWWPNGPDTNTQTDFVSQTQSYNLLGQLLAGMRYLDLRIEMHPTDGTIFHHGSKGLVYTDCTGRMVSTVIAGQVLPFISAFPSEFVIFDFQEISRYLGDPAATLADLQKVFLQYLQPDLWAVPASAVTSQLTLGQIRENGWRYMVLVSEAAYEAIGTSVADWAVPRLPGNVVGPPPAGVIWSPWDETIWNGPDSGVLAAINGNGAMWAGARYPGLFVAQAMHTPTSWESLGQDYGPLFFEADDGVLAGGFNQWMVSLPTQETDPPVNIVIQDAADWFPESVGALMQLNIERGNLETSAIGAFQLLIDAGTGAHVAPLLNGTATAVYFAGVNRDATDPSVAAYFNTQIDNTALKPTWTLEVGTPDLPNSEVILDQQSGVLRDGGGFDFVVPPSPPMEAGSVVSYFKLEALVTDGSNGWFSVGKGWVLQDALEIHVNAYGDQDAQWQLTVQVVSNVDPGILCEASG